MHGKPGIPGHQVVMAVMAVMAGTEPKVTRAAQERLDSGDLQELLVSMEKMAPKGNLESRVLLAKRGSAGRVEHVEPLELLV